MTTVKDDLQQWILDALEELKGRGTVLQISTWVWQRHEAQLRSAGSIFYTWQYDLRWAATKLRHKNRLSPVKQPGIYELAANHGPKHDSGDFLSAKPLAQVARAISDAGE